MRKLKYDKNQSPLYKLKSQSKLLQILKISRQELNFLISQADKNFYTFSIKQEGKKDREVQVPKKLLRHVHKRIFTLLTRISTPEYLHSSTKKRSYVTNAHKHLDADKMSRHNSIDIKSFFQSSTRKQVFNFFFIDMQCSVDIARRLSKLCTYNGHLPTGSSISSILSFFAYHSMFTEIHNLSLSEGTIMTLYVDDISFSGKYISSTFIEKIKDVLSNYKLKGHKVKTYGPGQKRVITGIVINTKSKSCDITNKRQKKIKTLRSKLNTVPDQQIKIKILQELAGRYFEADQVLHSSQVNKRYYQLGKHCLDEINQIQLTT